MFDNKCLISFITNVDKGNSQIYNSYLVLLDLLVITLAVLEYPGGLCFPKAAEESNSRRSRSTARLKCCSVQNLSPPVVTILHVHPHKCAQIHDAMSCCLLTSSDRVHWPLGGDDGCIRLMSWRLKVAPPSTSLGSTPTLLNSAPTKPRDSWNGVFTTLSGISMTPTKARLQTSQFPCSDWLRNPDQNRVAPQTTPSLTSV